MKRNFLSRTIVFLCLVFLHMHSLAQTDISTKPYAGLLWKAERENRTLYLYGVAHSASTALTISSQVSKLIESSDVYISELQLGKPADDPVDVKDINRKFIDKPFVLNDKAEIVFRKMHLEGVIGAYQYWALRHQSQIAATRGLFTDLIFKNYANDKNFATDFPKPHSAPDRLSLNIVNTKKITTLQIEPAYTADRYWLKNCDNERDNSAYILSVIDIAKNRVYKVSKIRESIFEGDLAEFQKLVDEETDLDFYRLDYQCHVIDRNKFWALQLNTLTGARPEKSTMFFTFGAMHGITPKQFPSSSLIDLLRQQGWRIQSMEVAR